MVNIFSKEQLFNITLTVGESVVKVNGSQLIKGTSSQCMTKIRTIVKNISYWMDRDKTIKFVIETIDSSPQIAEDKSYFINQIKLLGTSCNCRFTISSGIHCIG